MPVWLIEGMAELYSNLAPSGAKIVVGNVVAGRAQTLLHENWIDLRRLVSVDHNSPLYSERSQAGLFYAESWALVHMLNLDPAYRPHLRAMMEALNDGGAPAAFQKAYGKSIDQVQDDLRVYPTNATIPAAVFDIQRPGKAIAQLLQVKKVKPAEAPRYFYNLAYANYRLGDSAQARAFLEKGRPYATNPEEAAQLDRLSQALAAH